MNVTDREWIQSLPGNDHCFSCGCPHTTVAPFDGQTTPMSTTIVATPVDWASVTFGVVFCLPCSGVHRGLGVHVSFVQSLTLDHWTEEDTNRMKAGGNQALSVFLLEHRKKDVSLQEEVDDDDKTSPAYAKAVFTSPAATLYKQQLDEKARARDFATPKMKVRKKRPSMERPLPPMPLELSVITDHTNNSNNSTPTNEMEKEKEKETLQTPCTTTTTPTRHKNTRPSPSTPSQPPLMLTPKSTARALASRFQEYAHVMTFRQRQTPKRSISILNKKQHASPLAWKDIYEHVLDMLLEDVVLVRWMSCNSTTTWHSLASVVFFATSALFVLLVVMAAPRVYLYFFFVACTLGIGLPTVAVAYATKGLAQRMIEHRQAAFPSAKLLLLQRRLAKRVDHQDGFDLYLPPPPIQPPLQHLSVIQMVHNDNSINTSDNPTTNYDGNDPSQPTNSHIHAHHDNKPQRVPGLILLPGALVEHSAYAPLAAQLSDLGIVVAVVSLEPLRVGTVRHGIGPKQLLPIFYHVASHHGDAVEVVDWAIGGHDFGGMAAATVVRDLNLRKCVVLLGRMMMPMTSPTTTTSHDPRGSSFVVSFLLRQLFHKQKNNHNHDMKQKEDVQFLCIQASNNKSEGDTTEGHFLPDLFGVAPEAVQYETILGGNHAGFGHYGPQSFPIVDGKRTIPLAEQQLQTAESIASFLLEEPCIIERMGSVSTQMDSFTDDDDDDEEYVPFDYDSKKHQDVPENNDKGEEEKEDYNNDSEKENSHHSPTTATTATTSATGKQKTE